MDNAADMHYHQCGEGVETDRHILSQRRQNGFYFYMEQHNHALLGVFYDLRQDYGFEVMPRWWELKTLLVHENHLAMILWNVLIPKDRDIAAHHLHVILQGKMTGTSISLR